MSTRVKPCPIAKVLYFKLWNHATDTAVPRGQAGLENPRGHKFVFLFLALASRAYRALALRAQTLA